MATISGETRSIRLRLICTQPPPSSYEGEPTSFGLQDKRQALDPGQRQSDGSIQYECVVKVRCTEAGVLRFSGPCVHGRGDDPFLYLSWRREAGDTSWIRRLKISLASITWEQVVAASAPDEGLLEGTVSGTGSARVPLLGGRWQVHPPGSE